MNTNIKTIEMKDRKVILSTLWIFAMFNYLYADVFGLSFNPAAHSETLAMTQEAVLAFAIMMEIAIAMVLLSRFLKYGANRWANIIAGTIMTLVQISSLFVGTVPATYYLFFSVIEVACTALIVWYAWMWTNPEA